MFCKTIILSNTQTINSNAPKGILTLSKQGNTITGKIRLYNLTSLPINAKLGIYIQEKVFINPLTKKPNHYEFIIQQNLDISQSIYCAIIDNSIGDKKVLLEGGSFNGFYFTDSPFDAVLEAKDEQLEQVIDDAIKQSENCENCNNCENCEYKKFFYNNYSTNNDNINNELPKQINNPTTALDNTIVDDNLLSSQPPIDLSKTIASTSTIDLVENCNTPEHTYNLNASTIQQENNANQSSSNKDKSIDEKTQFLNDIIYQLDEMFTKYPEDDILTSIIPDSRFIKVDCDKPYVLGIIYENKMMKYIAYGVPAQYNSLPPADLGQHYQWLPLNPRDVMSDGYFMIYQDALDGTIVEINFEE